MQIVRALEGNISLEELNEGIKPGHSTIYDSYGSSDFDTTQYIIFMEAQISTQLNTERN